MDINVNFRLFGDSMSQEILTTVKQLGKKMANVQEVLDAVNEQQVAIQTELTSVSALLTEVRQLLAQGETVLADELLATIQANTQALTDSIAATDATTASVDAVNGDPVI